MKLALLVGMAFTALAVQAEKWAFERYQPIVDRQMFGPLPPGFDPTKSPSEVQKTSAKDERQLTQEQEKLQSAIHFSVINVAPDGATAVGFTDNTDPKTPRHYYLKIGEKRDGWEVKEADAATATMTIAKDEIEVSLKLGGDSAKDTGATARSGVASAATGGGTLQPGHRQSGLLGRGTTMRELRLQRRQREMQEAAAAQAKEKAEAAAKEAERQAQDAQEKQQREQERAEQRQQLLAIQEELKRVREAKEKEAKPDGGAEPNGGN